MTTKAKSVSWVWWPFVALWRLVTFIFEAIGRLLAMLLGVALMFVGVLLSLTVIGAIIGIPLIVFGFLLMLRGLF